MKHADNYSPSMGLLNTVGVLQAWVSEHQLHGYSESNIGWIFSAYAFFLYIGGAQVGKYEFVGFADFCLCAASRPHFRCPRHQSPHNPW
jgi:hypothetical protein